MSISFYEIIILMLTIAGIVIGPILLYINKLNKEYKQRIEKVEEVSSKLNNEILNIYVRMNKDSIEIINGCLKGMGEIMDERLQQLKKSY